MEQFLILKAAASAYLGLAVFLGFKGQHGWCAVGAAFSLAAVLQLLAHL